MYSKVLPANKTGNFRGIFSRHGQSIGMWSIWVQLLLKTLKLNNDINKSSSTCVPYIFDGLQPSWYSTWVMGKIVKCTTHKKKCSYKN